MTILQLRRYQKRDADLDAVAASGLASAWTAYTPAVSSGTGTITTLGTVSGRYLAIGKLTFVQVDIIITTNGTAATSIKFTLPSVPTRVYIATGIEANVTGSLLQVLLNASPATVLTYNNVYPGGSGYRIIASGFYEAT